MFDRKQLQPDEGDAPEVVTLLAAAVIEEFSSTGRGVHIDTALAGTSAAAGAFLLRLHAGTFLDDLSPGSVVLVDAVNEAGPALLGSAHAAASAAGVTWDDSGAPIPEANQPHENHLELVRRLEPALSQILRDSRTDETQWAQATVAAAVDLIVQARDVIDPRIATRIVTWGLVVGAKTVPYGNGSGTAGFGLSDDRGGDRGDHLGNRT